MNDGPEHSGRRRPLSGMVGRHRPETVRDVLVVVLTLATGATDSIGLLRLGGVFTSVMTGNMILLGVSLGKRDGSLALHGGAAFVGYVAGTWVGARLARREGPPRSVWPRAVSGALVVELAVFAVFAVWWVVGGGHPSGRATYVLIAVNSMALGIQSSAVLQLGVSGLSTTYLTGTLTQVVASLTSPHATVPKRSLVVLLALVAGAGLGAIVTVEVPLAAPAVPLGSVALVLVVATAAFGGSSRAQADEASAFEPEDGSSA